SEITQSGVGSKTVEQAYNRVIAALGPELTILQSAPAEDIGRASTALLAEAIARLRAGKGIRDPGYDGEYGVIRLLDDNDLPRPTAGGFLFDAPMARASKSKSRREQVGEVAKAGAAASPPPLAGEGQGGGTHAPIFPPTPSPPLPRKRGREQI